MNNKLLFGIPIFLILIVGIFFLFSPNQTNQDEAIPLNVIGEERQVTLKNPHYTNQDLDALFDDSTTNENVLDFQLKSHPSVDYIKKVGVGNQVVMFYDVNSMYGLSQALGEPEFTDMRSGQLVEREWRYVYLGNETYEEAVYSQRTLSNGTIITEKSGTETKTREAWLPYNSRDIPKGQMRIGIEVEVRVNDYIDGVWNVGGKRIDRHAEWDASLDDARIWYRLDEEASSGGAIIDATGNHNATMFGAVNTTGKIVYAYDFERGDATDQILIPSSSSLNFSAFTFGFWQNTESLHSGYNVRMVGTSETFYVANLVGGKIQFLLGATNFDSDDDYLVGTWQFVIVKRFSNGTMQMKINDTLQTSQPTDTGYTGTGNIFIGRDDGNITGYDGIMDEIFFYNRSTTDAEDTILYNNFSGCTYQLCDLVGGLIAVSLVEPSNDTQTNEDPITFNATITPTNLNLTNATLSVWFDNGTLWQTNTTTFPANTNTTQNISLTISGWEIDDYLWNVQAFGFTTGNSSDILNASGTSNFTLRWIPFEVSGESFNNETHETQNETFIINITTDATVSNIGAFLFYNRTDYAATHSCSSGLCQISREIDIPLVNSLTSENKTFFWKITLFGSTFGTFSANTTSHEQNVTNIIFNSTSTGQTLTINHTIHNETNRARKIADFRGTFNYWLGTGTVKDKFNFSGSGDSTYPFYINHNLTFKVNSEIEVKNETSERDYYFNEDRLTNTTTNRKLFLPDDSSSNIIVEVKDQRLFPQENIIVNISRYYPDLDIYEQVESQKTDEFGQFVAKLVQNDVRYKFTFYNINNELQKTSDRMTIACRSTICIVPFVLETIDDYFERFDNISLFSYELTFDNATNIFTYNWDDQTRQGARQRLEVIRYTLNQSTVVCNSTSTLTVASLTCSVGSSRATYKAQTFRLVNGENERRIDLLDVQVGSPVSTYGIEGLIWAFILLFTCIGIGAFNPSIGAILYGTGFIFLGVLGIISMPLSVFFANTIIVVLFAWAVRT